LLEELFEVADSDRSGAIERVEFDKLLLDDELCEDLCEATEMGREELPGLWRLLSRGEREHAGGVLVETIVREDFVEGLLSCHGSVDELSVLRLEKRIVVIERAMLKAAKTLGI